MICVSVDLCCVEMDLNFCRASIGTKYNTIIAYDNARMVSLSSAYVVTPARYKALYTDVPFALLYSGS